MRMSSHWYERLTCVFECLNIYVIVCEYLVCVREFCLSLPDSED